MTETKKTETVLKEISFKQYTAKVVDRSGSVRFPDHNYGVQIFKASPRSRYGQTKLLQYYVYKTMAHAYSKAETYIATITANITSRDNAIKAKREANKLVRAEDYYKPGDILVNSWGYEQTNIEFYEVTEVKGKTITCVEIAQRVEEGSDYSHGMACNVLPVPGGLLTGQDKTYKLRVKAGGNLSQPKSYYYFHKWNGRPMYKSWYY